MNNNEPLSNQQKIEILTSMVRADMPWQDIPGKLNEWCKAVKAAGENGENEE